MLTRAQIEAADDRRIRAVPVAEWGGDVGLASLSAARLVEFESRLVAAKEAGGGAPVEVMLWMLGLSLVDGEGRRLFPDGEEGALRAKDREVLVRLFEEVCRHNARTEEAQEQAEKNSAPSPPAAS